MSKMRCRSSLLLGFSGLVLVIKSWAGIPVWTFTRVAGYPPVIFVNSTENKIIKYKVINQSRRMHILRMRPISGITSTGCTQPLYYHGSCTLILQVRGSTLKGGVTGGPVLCELRSPLQCYQPSAVNSLIIRLIKKPTPTPVPTKQYTIIPSTGSNGAILPSTPKVVNAGASLTFTATPHLGYGVEQWLLDGNFVKKGGRNYQLKNINANHRVKVSFAAITLTPSVTTLALSINCQPLSTCTTTQNAALTGNSREITIKNEGKISVTNVSVETSGFPSGTQMSNNECIGTLAPNDTCKITLTPGSVASSDISNVACTSGKKPISGKVTITADDNLSTEVDVYVLGYGCQYQEGFLYSVNDSYAKYPISKSIGGKVASLVDQAAPSINGGVPQLTSIIWSSNGNGGAPVDISYDSIYAIAENSTVDPLAPNPNFGQVGDQEVCTGASNGECNTRNIYIYYQNYSTVHPVNLDYYAVGLCKKPINNYTNWYLPAPCELGTQFCNTVIENMQDNLAFLIGNPNGGTPRTSCNPPPSTDCLAGEYWTSAESSLNATQVSMIQGFTIAGSYQFVRGKDSQRGVRCSRALTP